jgi:hypothetical protein
MQTATASGTVISREVLNDRRRAAVSRRFQWPGRKSGGGPTQPVASLATDAVTRPAMRRHASVWAVGMQPRKLYSSRMPRALFDLKASHPLPYLPRGGTCLMPDAGQCPAGTSVVSELRRHRSNLQWSDRVLHLFWRGSLRQERVERVKGDVTIAAGGRGGAVSPGKLVDRITLLGQ